MKDLWIGRLRRHWVQLAAALVVTAGMAVYLNLHGAGLARRVEETVVWTNTGSHAVGTAQLQPDTLYRQPFTALGDTLWGLHFPLCGVDPEGGDGLITVSITDGAGNTLYSRELREQELAAGGYWTDNDSDYYIVMEDLDLSVTPGETCYLELYLSDCTGVPVSYWTVSAVGEDGYENFHALDAGAAAADTALYIQYQSYRETSNLLPPLLALYGLFLLLLFLPAGRWYSWLGRGALAALPVFVFCAFEFVAGNLTAVQPQYAAYTVLLLYLVLAAAAALGVAGPLLVLAAANLLSLANYFVTSFRGLPISVADLAAVNTAAAVAAGYEYALPFEYLLVSLAALCMGVVLVRGRSAEKRRKRQLQQGREAQRRFVRFAPPAWAARLAVCGVSLLCLAGAFASLPTAGYDTWRPDSNFSRLGWLYTNCVRLQQSRLQKPAGYSAASAAALLEETPAAGQSGAERPANLIVIMNESFSDLTVLGDLALSQDAMPFLHSLQENMETGWLSVPVLGGGTCNSEWEVLSGNSKMLTDISFDPYYTFYTAGTPRYNPSGLPASLAEAGYRTVALHPCTATNWNRDVAYGQMSFDSFLSDADFTDPRLVHGWISDESCYRKIVECFESKAGGELFVFAVTMQNHGGYLANTEDVEQTVWLLDDPDNLEASTYFSLMYESDRAFQGLVEYFEGVDEPTMIVMFGDHQPSLAAEFYSALYGTEDLSGLSNEVRELQYITPYVIWTNYDRTVSGHVPYLSANYFGAYIKRAAGLETDAYDEFRLAFLEKYPVVGHYGIFDSAYAFTPYGEMTAEQKADLDRLDQVQYYHMTNFSQ